MNIRNGKIARLPRDLREELNLRLERSEQSPRLLAWLNALPDVQVIVRGEFAGMPVNKQNLSAWRRGGFQEWRLRKEFWAEVRQMAHGKNQTPSQTRQTAVIRDQKAANQLQDSEMQMKAEAKSGLRQSDPVKVDNGSLPKPVCVEFGTHLQ